MLRAAVLVVLLGGAIQIASFLPVVLSQPEALVVVTMFAWLLWGAAPGVAVATTAWTILNLGWAIDHRLDPALAGQDIIVSGTVCDFPRDDGRARRFVFAVAAGPNDPALPARLYLSSYNALRGELAAGQRWRLKLRLKRPRGLSNPGAFDFERWALERRIGATGYVRESTSNRRLSASFGHCPSMRARQFVAAAIERAVGSRRAGRFMPGIAVGARNRLTQADWDLLRKTGTTHLMAISGLHVGLVAGLLLWIGRRLAPTKLLANLNISPLFAGRILSLAGATLYAGMAGFAVPTTRALVMVGVCLILATVRRVIGAWQILGAALLAVVWTDPFAMLGAGFWLSFGAVAILLLAGMSLPERGPPTGIIARRLASLVWAQWSLSIGLAPLTWMFFSAVSIVAPFINVVAVPVFAALVVPLTLLGSLFVPFVPFVAGMLLTGAAVLLDVGLTWLARMGEWPVSVWRPLAPGGGWALAAFAGAVLLCWPRPTSLRWLGIVPMIVVALGLNSATVPPLRIVVMDVGQGLAVLVQTPDHALLYDAGPAWGRRDAGQTVVLPVLRHYGVRRLDAMLISHGDNDHIGGARTILDAYPDARLIATEEFGLPTHSWLPCEAGVVWRWDEVDFRVLHPSVAAGRALAGENNRSCVLSVVTSSVSVLLPGDIERSGESSLVNSGVLRRHDIVIAPHHGSSTSSSPPFVAAVAARVVVFATGFANRWGFPAEPVRERWTRRGACSLDTAATGALVFEAADSGGLRLITRQRAAARFVWTEGVITGDDCSGWPGP